MATVLDELLVHIGPKFVGRGELRRLERGIQRAEQRLDTLAGKFAQVGAALTALAGGTLAAFSSQEAKWAEVSAKTGVSVEELRAKYEKAARSISEETGIATTKILDGFQKAISAGFEGEEAIKLVGAAAKAEASGIGALEDQVSAATTVMTAFGEEGETALDMIARAAQVGEGDTEDFANSLKGVTQLAEPMGIEFAELAATLANVSQTAKSVPEAETQLNAFLKALADPSEEARKALEDFTNGLITFEDLQANLKTEGLASVVGTLQTIAEEDPSKIAALFPEVEAQKFFNTVDPRIVEELFRQIEAGEGTIERAFGEGADTVKRRWDQTRETFKNIAADIGETMAPAFAELAKRIKIVFEWFNSLNPKVKEYIGYALSAGPAVLVLSGFLKGLSMALAGVRYVLPLVVAALKPLLKLIAAHPLLALIAGLIAVAIYWREIRDAIMWVYDEFVKLMREWGVPIDDIFDWIGAAWDKVLGWISGPQEGQSVFAWLSEPFVGLFDWVRVAWDAVIGYLSAKHPAVFAWLDEADAAIFAWVNAAWDAMVAGLVGPGGLWDWLQVTVSAPFAWVDQAWAAMLDRLVGPLDGLWGWLTAAVDAPFQWVDDAWGWMLSRLVPPLDDLWAFLTPDINADTILLPIREAWQQVLSWLREFSLAEVGAAIIGTLVDGIESAAQEVVDAVTGAFDTVMEYMPFSDARRGPLSRLTESGRAIVETLAEGMRSAAPLRAALASGVLALPAADALAAPLPIGPVPPAAASSGGVTLNITLGEGAIRIDAPGADAQEIASRLGDALAEEMRALAEEVDGNALA